MLGVPTELTLVHSGELRAPPPHPAVPLLPAQLAGAAFSPEAGGNVRRDRQVAPGAAGTGLGVHCLRSSRGGGGDSAPDAAAGKSQVEPQQTSGVAGAVLVLWSEDGTVSVMHVADHGRAADGEDPGGGSGSGSSRAGVHEGEVGVAVVGMLPVPDAPGACIVRGGSMEGAAGCAQVGFGPGGRLVRMAPLRHAERRPDGVSNLSVDSRACADITNVMHGGDGVPRLGVARGAKRGTAEPDVHAWDTRLCCAAIPVRGEPPGRDESADRAQQRSGPGAGQEEASVPLLLAASTCIADVFGKGDGVGGMGDGRPRGCGAAGAQRRGDGRVGPGGGAVEHGQLGCSNEGAEQAGGEEVEAVRAWPRTTSRTLLSTSADMPPCMALGRSDGSILLQPLMFAAVQTAANVQMRHAYDATHAMHQPHGSMQQFLHCSGLGRHPSAGVSWSDGCAACMRVMHGHHRPITCMAEADLQRSVISVGIPHAATDDGGAESTSVPVSPVPRLDSFPEEGGAPVPVAGATAGGAAGQDPLRSGQALTAQRSLNSMRPRPVLKGPPATSAEAAAPELAQMRSGGMPATPKGLAALRSIFTGPASRRQRGARAGPGAQSPPSDRQRASFERESQSPCDGAGTSTELPGAAAVGDAELATASPDLAPVDISESGGPCHRVLLSGCEAGRVCAWGVSTWHMDGQAAAEPPFGSAGGPSSGRTAWDAGLNPNDPGGLLAGFGPLHDPWSTFGEPLFSVHALAEPVWQIVLPPQNAPPPWHQCGSSRPFIVLPCSAGSVLRSHTRQGPPGVVQGAGNPGLLCFVAACVCIRLWACLYVCTPAMPLYLAVCRSFAPRCSPRPGCSCRRCGRFA